jgi:hypothetical protein
MYLTRVLAVALLFAGTAFAHHSRAMYEPTKSVTVEGVVKDVAYKNPHIWVNLIVKDPQKGDQVWGMEGGNLGGLYRMGWTQDTVKAGDKIKMEVHPMRDGMPGGQILRVTLADGKVLGERGGGARGY